MKTLYQRAPQDLATAGFIEASQEKLAMKFTRSMIVVSLLAFSGAALAQSPAPATPAPASSQAQKPRSAKSLECSKQADSQNLHGKPRHAFMGKCKKS